MTNVRRSATRSGVGGGVVSWDASGISSEWSAVVAAAVTLVVTLIVTLIGQRIDNRRAIEANGWRIDERFDALQALILEALEACRAQVD